MTGSVAYHNPEVHRKQQALSWAKHNSTSNAGQTTKTLAQRVAEADATRMVTQQNRNRQAHLKSYANERKTASKGAWCTVQRHPPIVQRAEQILKQ